MKKLIVPFLAIIALGVSFWAVTHKSVVTSVINQPVGAAASPDHYNYEQFFNGLAASKFSGLYSVNASTTSSTAPTLQLGAGSQGVITVGTSTPAIRIQSASTTAITANSMVFLQQTTSGPPGVTCNTTQATNTLTSISFISTASSTLNGFTVTLGALPVTNPSCFDYWIVDRSKSGY